MSDEVKRMRHTLAKIADAVSEFANHDADSGDPSETERCGGSNGGRTPKKTLKLRNDGGSRRHSDCDKHVYRKSVVCETDERGFPTPENADPTRIVLHAPDGFIRLWSRNTTLNWRFRESSMRVFEDPAGAMNFIEMLFQQAVSAWGTAVPVRFSKQRTGWDFEIVMRNADDCDGSGCVLASAFFPDSGRHQLYLYPKMFEQSRQEQIETLVHELGHVFGLRHFFANVSETSWPSEIFGTHSRFMAHRKSSATQHRKYKP